MAKIIKNNRAKQRARIVQNLTQTILDNLARIAKGKTVPEVITAQVDYYFSCNIAEREILLKMFKDKEDKTLTEIANFFAEK